jgi:hypothetical protein
MGKTEGSIRASGSSGKTIKKNPQIGHDFSQNYFISKTRGIGVAKHKKALISFLENQTTDTIKQAVNYYSGLISNGVQKKYSSVVSIERQKYRFPIQKT